MRIAETINLHMGSYGIIINSSNHRQLERGEQSLLYATRRPDLIHISIKLHEDIPTVTALWHTQNV